MVISGTSAFTPLDRELVDQYALTVTVNDGEFAVSHNFVVLILDVNDEIPQLDKDTYIVPSELSEISVDGSLFYLYYYSPADKCHFCPQPVFVVYSFLN